MGWPWQSTEAYFHKDFGLKLHWLDDQRYSVSAQYLSGKDDHVAYVISIA